MSLGKLPGLKGLVSTSHRKRRFKRDLTADMISPPLGDFRHTMHVGRGGDVFGDTSFLSNHGGTGNGLGDPDSPSSKTVGFFSRTLRHVRRSPAQLRDGSQDLSPPPPPVSPIIKNAISLPRLDGDAPNGSLQRVLFPASPSSPEESTYSYGVESGFATLPRLSRADRQPQDGSETCNPEFRRSSVPDTSVLSLPHSDSISSFTVDLGPSLMSEVFGVIDSPRGSLAANHGWEEEGPSSSQNHVACSAATSLGGSPLREDLNVGGFGSCGRKWEEEGREPPKKAIPDVVSGSPTRVEPGMEPVRFQMAADVLSRHYGGGGLLKGKQQTEGWEKRLLGPDIDSVNRAKRRLPCSYNEEEDEIKV
ncbi:hypothetical protein MATL_G00004550 [Megalops atlanticus]|uniref:CRIB domain-containing protein n=1 Tax=Megalops atlanticus TaxID=7932 RepID=A0A9D3QKE0_MEGAT|nr:hypothetical protein MATL_G00004550 [Megalops atlanticus]